MNDNNDLNQSNPVSTSGISGGIIRPSVIRPPQVNTVQDAMDSMIPKSPAAPSAVNLETPQTMPMPMTERPAPNFSSEMTNPAAPIMNTVTNFEPSSPSQETTPVAPASPSEPISANIAGSLGAIAGAAQPLPQFMQQTPDTSQTGNIQPKKKRGLKVAIVALVTVVLLSGVGAAAYLGYVLPNKPENKLGLSLLNAMKNEQGTISGKIDFKSKTGDNMAVALDYSIKSNDKGEGSVSGNLGVQGTSFPFESVYVNKDIYLKVGGLNAIASLLPEAESSGLDFSKLSDTWFVINRSLLQSSEQANCALDANITLSEGDQSKLETAYKAHPLFLIESSSSEKLDGQSVTKMVVKPTTDGEFDKFAKELENLELYKTIKGCLGESTETIKNTLDEEVKPEDNSDLTTSITMYVGKGNQLKKVEIKASDDESSLDMDMNFDWSPVTITKPEGAKPIQEILSALDLNLPSTEPDFGADLDSEL